MTSTRLGIVRCLSVASAMNCPDDNVWATLMDGPLPAHEADAVAKFFEAKECPYMSIEDTLGQMRTLDMLRESAGLNFGAK